MKVPGIGPVAATVLAATVDDATVFESGRYLAAWLGLVPRQTSSGGKKRLGGISKAGDGYLRRMLVNGARAVMRWHGKTSPWLAGLLARRPFNVAVVALANKLARIAWAVMARGEEYRKPAVTGRAACSCSPACTSCSPPCCWSGPTAAIKA
jgi:transposase